MNIRTDIDKTMADAETIPALTPRPKAKARKRAFILLGGVIALGLVGYGLEKAVFAAPSEETEDAYVAGDVVAITSREATTVTALHADNTQSVKAGEPLLDLDASTADANRAQADADLGRVVRSVRSNFAQVKEAAAAVAKAQSDLDRAKDDLTRRRAAVAEGAVSNEEVDHANEGVQAAQAALDLAKSRYAEAEAAVQGASIAANPNVLAAAAAVRRSAIVQRHMRIIAPVDGVIAQRTVQLGQQVVPGAPLMAVVPLGRAWVDANFRETQLADLRVGQPATITSDAYGHKTVFHGHVIGLGAGSGNAFALLPPQNASGNWIKIVQRVPVRVALDKQELTHHPLQLGLSVTVKVDTRNHAGEELAQPARGAFLSEAPEDAGPGVEARIAEIIAANSGAGA
jgi:membrane fusion protein (multidrug efflux system)